MRIATVMNAIRRCDTERPRLGDEMPATPERVGPRVARPSPQGANCNPDTSYIWRDDIASETAFPGADAERESRLM